MTAVYGRIGVVEAKLGDKGETVDLEVGGEGGGYYAGGRREAGAFCVVEVFCSQGKAVPGFGIYRKIECGAPPAAGGGIFLDGQAGFVEAAVKAKAKEGAGPRGQHEIVLMDAVVLDVASAGIIEIEL